MTYQVSCLWGSSTSLNQTLAIISLRPRLLRACRLVNRCVQCVNDRNLTFVNYDIGRLMANFSRSRHTVTVIWPDSKAFQPIIGSLTSTARMVQDWTMIKACTGKGTSVLTLWAASHHYFSLRLMYTSKPSKRFGSMVSWDTTVGVALLIN